MCEGQNVFVAGLRSTEPIRRIPITAGEGQFEPVHAIAAFLAGQTGVLTLCYLEH